MRRGAEGDDTCLRRADLGFWADEIFVSLNNAAGLMDGLGDDPDAVLRTYRLATETCRARAEARHGASRYRRLRDRFAECFHVARDGLALTAPTEGLFVETLQSRHLMDWIDLESFGCSVQIFQMYS